MRHPSTARHEAGHCVSVLRLEQEYAKILEVSIDRPVETRTLGRTQVLRNFHKDHAHLENVGRAHRALVTALCGYLAEGVAPVQWPPKWTDAQVELREDLGPWIVEWRIDQDTYYRLAEVALDLAADPAFRLDVDLLVLELEKRKKLTGPEVEQILR
jgi:hypothetical protein